MSRLPKIALNTATETDLIPALVPGTLAVLLVDDEPLIRWSLRRALVDRGHFVLTAGNATDAIAALSTGEVKFDAVILDYRLPDRQDLTLLDEVRRLSPQSAVFMMTAFADDGMKSGAHDRGARAVVDKPFNVGSFVSLVESAFK